MDTQLDWLSAVASGQNHLAPPPVSFGSSSSFPRAPAPPDYPVPSALADNLWAQARETRNDGARSDGAAGAAADNDESVPLSLTALELTLEESKTYMRWYLDILARTNQRTITMNDVYHFLSNFRLSAAVKQKINRIFVKILRLINIGEFFALLRVVSHTLEGKEPTRLLVRQKAPVPVPVLILQKKRHSDDDDKELLDLDPAAPADPAADPAQPPPPLDLDLFTQFMLTGQRPGDRGDRVPKRPKKGKSVKFSDQVVSDVHKMDETLPDPQLLDYLLPMDQLMLRLNHARAPLSPDPEEKQILADMAPQINHFRNLHSVDTMLVDGVPANIHLNHGLPRPPLPQPSPAPLQPNMTGPAQMRTMVHDLLLPLRPNVTGPADMARFMDPPSVSLQSFTAHMTPDTAANTSANAHMDTYDTLGLPQPSNAARPPVPAHRTRSLSLPDPVHLVPPPVAPPAPAFGLRSMSLSPVPPPLPPKSPPGRTGLSPPPPPVRRRGASLASSPAPLASIDSLVAPQSNTAHHTYNAMPNTTPAALYQGSSVYQNSDASSSTANILDDLKALQEEVDKIRDMAGGF